MGENAPVLRVHRVHRLQWWLWEDPPPATISTLQRSGYNFTLLEPRIILFYGNTIGICLLFVTFVTALWLRHHIWKEVRCTAVIPMHCDHRMLQPIRNPSCELCTVHREVYSVKGPIHNLQFTVHCQLSGWHYCDHRVQVTLQLIRNPSCAQWSMQCTVFNKKCVVLRFVVDNV